MKIKIEVSARHIHLSKEDLNVLFGEDYELTPIKDLSQKGEFAAEEKLNLKVEEETIEGVRIIGPLREKTQVEISKTDCFFFNLNAPLRLSGNIEGSASAVLIGPEGKVILSEGVIVAKRHIHCNKEECLETGLKEGDIVSVEIKGERSIIFNNVEIRIKDNYRLAMHIDTDEGNTAGVYNIGEGEILE